MNPVRKKPQCDTPIFTDSFEKIQEYTLHIREGTYTGRQVIILVHGIGVSEKYYRRFAYALAESYDVISVDLPGYGKAEKPKEVLTLEQLAIVLNEFINKRAIRAPVLVGQSMGCQIVAHFAASFPGKAKKLILLSPTVNNKERSLFLQLIRLLQDIGRESLSGNVLVLREYIRFGIRRFIVTQQYMIKDQPEKIVPLVSIPILIVRGSRDTIVPRAWAQMLLKIAKYGAFQEIPHGSHNFHWTHPKEAANACDNFIQK
jgi:pimeloyl-ACP methyl ester carboxylesterase